MRSSRSMISNDWSDGLCYIVMSLMRPVESFTLCFEETTMPVCPWQYYKRAREVFAHNID